MKKRTAVLVNGAFFLKRYRSINKVKNFDPIKIANYLWEMCLKHLTQAKEESFEHIDGLVSKIKKPMKNNNDQQSI